jgi:predicted TIM-barrel fold metal-dependent hydrolase
MIQQRVTTMNADIFNSAAALTRRDVLAAGVALALGKAGLTQAASPAEEIIDIHPHIISRDLKRYPPSPVGDETSDWSQEHPQTFEDYVAAANAAGIAKAAIVQASTFYGINNTYLAESVTKYPKRFTGVGSIDTLAPDAVKVLEAWMRRGISGLRIRTGGARANELIDPRAAPVWEYAAQKGFTVCISTQAAGMAHVRTLLQRYPQVKVVLDHASMVKVEDGAPYRNAAAFFELAQFRNFYVKITPRTFELSRTGKSTPETFFPKLVSVFGADHLAFGSNLPSDEGPLTKLVADAKICFASLSAADRAMVFSGTAKRLYPALA